jgi:hypothetical protein
MTVAGWQLWSAMPLVYLGAFLSGIRPGRWFGTRLIPLVAAGFWVLLANLMPWWWLSGLITLIGIVAGIVAILHQLTSRDF